MKHGVCIALCLLLTGCTKQNPATPQAEPTKKGDAQSASGRVVSLDQRMQREGGIVVEPARKRSVPQSIRATGRITVNELRTWRVGAVTDGRIIRILVNPGDSVTKGQVLARMHSHDIHEARALYRKAISDLDRLKSLEAYSQRTRDRMRRLHELKAASLEQVDHAETDLRSAQAGTRQAQVEVERTQQHMVEFLQIPLDEPKGHAEGVEEPDSDLIPIKSPATGTILARNVTPGTVVNASGDLFVVSDLSQLWVIAAVNEEYLPRLKPGLPASISVQAYPNESFGGRITRIGEELDATTRTVKARIEVPNLRGRLKPEMYVSSEISTGGSDLAIFVPQSAPQEVDGQTVVFVRTAPDRFEVRPVAFGRTVEGLLEATNGLREGESVVTRGSFLLKSQLMKSSMRE